jgi:transposase
MDATRNLLVRQTIVGEPERRDDERSEAVRSGGSPTIVRETSSAAPDPEVTARHARRRFTTHYKLEILRKADACTRPGQLGALLRKEGLYSSLLVTWRRQREDGLTPKKRGRKGTPVDPQLKKLEQENRHLTRRLQKAEALLAFQKKVSELLQIPLKPFVSDEDD